MIPARVNPLTSTRNDVDARLLFVINMNVLNYLPSEMLSFLCKNLSRHLVKKEILAHGSKVVRDSVMVCGIRFN